MSAQRRSRRSFRLKCARDYLIRALVDNTFGETGYLPPMATLARAAGVSLVTMWKAINDLKREGALAGDPRHRIRIAFTAAAPQQTPLPLAESNRAWCKVKARLQRDILNGVFSRAIPLPSAKELAVRYSVSASAAAKALRSLVEELYLVRDQRRLYLRPVAAFRAVSHSRVAVLAYARQSVWQEIEWEYWHTEFLRQLEAECVKARLQLDIYSFTEENDGLCLRDNARDAYVELDHGPDVLGYLYLVRGMEGVRESLLNLLVRTGKPLAIFDEIGGWAIPRAVLQSPNAKVFRSTALPKPGETVARYLLELGHRSIAYFSATHAFAWSRRRLEGLQKGFAIAGIPDGVKPFTLNAMLKSDLLAKGMLRSDLAAQIRRFREEMLAPLPAAYSPSFDNAFSLMRFCARQGEAYHQMTPLFEKALATPGLTAWVIASGKLSVSALDFLKRNKIRLPQDLSLVSFDDLPECVPVRLTSYNFNFPAVMQAMLHFAVNREYFPDKRKVVEIDGFLIERQSCGQVLRR